MSYETDKIEGMLANDPEDMTRHELGLALYHIGAKTILSQYFTIEFVDRVVLRASQLLYNAIDWSEVHPSGNPLGIDAVEHLKGDWSIDHGDGDDWSVSYSMDVPACDWVDPSANNKDLVDIRYPDTGSTDDK